MGRSNTTRTAAVALSTGYRPIPWKFSVTKSITSQSLKLGAWNRRSVILAGVITGRNSLPITQRTVVLAHTSRSWPTLLGSDKREVFHRYEVDCAKMNRKDPKVDSFFRKAKKWQAEFKKLRTIALDCGLTEELKWGKPCCGSGAGTIEYDQAEP